MRAPILILALIATARPAGAIDLPADFQEQVVRTGFNLPISFRFLPDGRILVAQQKNTPVVRMLIDGEFATTDPVLAPAGVNAVGNERGLLSIEVDPEWPARPFIYCYYNWVSGGQTDTRVTRYTANGDLDGSGSGELSFDVNSALHILSGIPDLESNHNGGDLRFGPDGKLYVSTGDDEETRCLAQELDSLLGKILRLDVSGLALGRSGSVDRSEIAPADNPFFGQGEIESLIHAYGMRNPVRYHIDRVDGSIFVCDVGKDDWEEISHIENPGENLGWPHREGAHVSGPSVVRTACLPEPVPFVYLPPIDEYSHLGHANGLSIMGGEVYRVANPGPGAWPIEYRGDVFYAEYYEGWIVRLSGSGQSYAPEGPFVQGEFWATNNAGGLSDMMVGPDNALYYLSQFTGSLRRIVYTGPAGAAPSSFGSVKALFGG